jgi:hypothetical protein
LISWSFCARVHLPRGDATQISTIFQRFSHQVDEQQTPGYTRLVTYFRFPCGQVRWPGLCR